MFLGDLPDGANILIDANILVYHRIQIPGLTETVINFLERVERRQVVGYTSMALVAEAVHKVMLAEAVQQYGLPEKGIVTRLKAKPDLVKGLTHAQVTEEIQRMNVSIEPVTVELVKEAERLFSVHGLLTNDSITLALMRRLSLTHIATNDEDFESVNWLTVWKPL